MISAIMVASFALCVSPLSIVSGLFWICVSLGLDDVTAPDVNVSLQDVVVVFAGAEDGAGVGDGSDDGDADIATFDDVGSGVVGKQLMDKL